MGSPREVAPVEASRRQLSKHSRDEHSLLEADGDNICLQRENSSAQSQPVLASNSQTEALTSAALEALRDAYTFISQPQRMTPTEATYRVHPYNRLTAKLRAAIASLEAAR